MSLADAITPEIPYLRRYARALTGNQGSGDSYVVATIDALANDQSIFPKDLSTRVALYRTFLKIWDSVDVNAKVDPTDEDPAAGATRTLQSVTPRARQALLLTALEGFTAAEAASALDVNSADFANLIDQAGHEIADQVATTVLIIEDEPLIAADIKSLVTSLGHEVTGTARTRDEAIHAAAQNQPGLILADIQLADGSSGIDAVHTLLESFTCPVIFITAYPERLLTGLRPEPTFLITKPFEDETVKAIISQALFFNATAHNKS